MIPTLVLIAGGHIHLERLQNAMSWLEQVVQSFIRHVAPHCAVIAACGYGANWDKAWLFATSFDKLQTLAGTCQHPRGSHESVMGTRATDGSFLSCHAAEYPQKLAAAFASFVHPLQSPSLIRFVIITEAIQRIPLKSLTAFLFSSE